MSACEFCKGGPVGNAASWVDGKPRPPAACPRCGETNGPMTVFVAVGRDLKAARAHLEARGVEFTETTWQPGVHQLAFDAADWPKLQGVFGV